jgi:hypothetical protein
MGPNLLIWMCPAQIFLSSKQHTQKILGYQLFAKKLQMNYSAQLFGFAQKILETKHALIKHEIFR